MDEVFFAQAFDRAPVGMAFLRSDGALLSANPALVSILGKDLWLIVGSHLEAHLRTEDGTGWRNYFAGFTAGEAVPGVFESRFLPQSGRVGWWSIQLADIDRLWGGERCIFAVIQDITPKKLSDQKLREARQLAEAASRAKSQFLANMSHEIRTPLFTITGMTELLGLSELGRDQAHHATQIASAAHQLLDLVNDILDFSKIEAGQMSLESIPFDLDEVLAGSLEVVTLSAYRKGVELVLDLEPSVPRSWLGDPGRLRQILVNLLSNAVKFTQEGRVIVRVTHLVLDSTGREQLSLRVIDTGIGISEAAKSGLFQVFSQADSSTTRQFGGTGLGLAICQKLVRLLGGEIGFTSETGKGSEFAFTVELKRLQPPELPWGGQGKGRRLLLIDDDPGVRDTLRTVLGKAGFRVQAVPTREAALDLLTASAKKFVPDAVLLDQEVLGADGRRVDGWLVATELQQITGDTPFVLLSVLRKTFEPSPRFPAQVFRGAVDKPVNPRLLVDYLVQGLAGQWPGQTLPLPGLPRSEIKVVRTARILVAEDHEVNRQLFQMLLTSLGHDVLLVENGREALDQVLAFNPQLVFMDLQMPEMNGYESASGMRKKGVAVPIIAVTASAVKGELERCLAAGMNGILTKPFTLEALDGAIRSFSPHLVVTKLPEAPSSNLAFSLQAALPVFLGNRELLLSLLARFIPRTRDTLTHLTEARQAGNWPQVAALAHAIKGSSLNLTAKALGDAAAALETSAKEGKDDDSLELERRLVEAFDAFVAEVTPLL